MSESDLLNVPNYITASSPEKLRVKMVENNYRMGMEVKYQDIVQLSNGSFIAWFYEKYNLDINKPMRTK